MGAGRLAVLERWLPYTVTILGRFHFYKFTVSYSMYAFTDEETVKLDRSPAFESLIAYPIYFRPAAANIIC